MRKAIIILVAGVLFAAMCAWPQSAPVLVQDGVVDAASFGRVISPGMLVSIFGTGFAQNTVQAPLPFPTTVEGISVELDDGTRTILAPIFVVSPGQINAQIPYLNAGTTLRVRVRNANGVSNADQFTLVERAPRLLTTTMNGQGDPLLLHSDFTMISDDSPAEAGENVVLYIVGLGAVDPPVEAGAPAGDGAGNGPLSYASGPVQVAVGGLSADVQFAGLAPGFAGLYQLNFVMPPNLAGGRHPVTVSAAGQTSQANVSATVIDKTSPRQFFAAPDGTPGGNGSRTRPWDLKTALSPPAAVRPGDTIWLRGGTYGEGPTIFESRLAGTAEKPIRVRQFAGERATINGGLAIFGPHTWYWGFEVTNTNRDRTATRVAPECVDTYDGSAGVKLINLVLHDCNTGMGFWLPAENAEAYGNLIYHNGWQGEDRGHGHGIYTQNRNGTKTIRDNIVFNQFALGIQAYGSNNTFVQGYDMQGNAVFNNGIISKDATSVDNILFGAGSPMERIRIENNYSYHAPDTDKGYSRVGWGASEGVANRDVVVRKNYWIGGQVSLEMWNWNQVDFTENTLYSKASLLTILSMLPNQSARSYTWDNNTYYGVSTFRLGTQNQQWSAWKTITGLDANSKQNSGRPQGTWTFVRPNQYEAGRANIVIYNWDLRDSVTVDVAGVLNSGAKYEVRDAQNFFGDPVATGTYDGTPVRIPMRGLQLAPPVGDVPSPPKHTAPEFGVFILLQK